MSAFIKEEIGHFILSHDWYDYKYTWFLTCLYHDIASNIERGKLPANPPEQQKHLTYYLGDNNIQYGYQGKLIFHLTSDYSLESIEIDGELAPDGFTYDDAYYVSKIIEKKLNVSPHVGHYEGTQYAIFCASCIRKSTENIKKEHTCEVCKKDGTYKIIGLSGNEEYYCKVHYDEMNNMLKKMLGG